MSSSGKAFLQAGHPARPAGLAFSTVTDADWPFLANVYADSRAEELAQVPWPEESKAAFLRQQFEAQRLHYSTHYAGADLHVVHWQEQPAGRVYVYRGGSELRLMDIAILRTFRGQGLARAMLTELLEEADAAGLQLSLHVEHENPVRRLYQRLGFEVKEERGAYVFMCRPARAQAA